MYSSVVEAVFDHASNNPDKLCLVDNRGEITYSEFRKLILKLATELKENGITKGDRVIVEAIQSISFLAIEYALQIIGAIFVPVEHNSRHEKIEFLTEKAGAGFVLSGRGDSFGERRSLSVDQLVSGAEENGKELTEYQLPAPENVSSILFSTGTTGNEKGIVISFANDIALCENVIHAVNMQNDNVEMILSPFNHSHGLRRYYANMFCGATVVMMDSVMDMKRLFTCFEKYHINSMDLVPSALSVILKLSGNKLTEYSNQLRYIQMGGAALIKENKEKLKELLPQTRLYNMYGSTESGIGLIYDFNVPDEKENCIGKPAVNATVYFVDEERRKIDATEENPGYLAFRGPMNMIGYWNDPKETSLAMKDGILYTKDLAYQDQDGDVIYLGRNDDVINIGGKKVSPTEIESAAARISGIIDCVCIPEKHPARGEIPRLLVQMKPGESFDAKIIRSEISKYLEPYKVPERIEQVETIPRTYKGSVQRTKMKDIT